MSDTFAQAANGSWFDAGLNSTLLASTNGRLFTFGEDNQLGQNVVTLGRGDVRPVTVSFAFTMDYDEMYSGEEWWGTNAIGNGDSGDTFSVSLHATRNGTGTVSSMEELSPSVAFDENEPWQVSGGGRHTWWTTRQGKRISARSKLLPSQPHIGCNFSMGYDNRTFTISLHSMPKPGSVPAYAPDTSVQFGGFDAMYEETTRKEPVSKIGGKGNHATYVYSQKWSSGLLPNTDRNNHLKYSLSASCKVKVSITLNYE